MRRDIANEIVVAIVAVAVIAFALTFGILLTLSSSTGVFQPGGGTDVAAGGTENGINPMPTNRSTLTSTEDLNIFTLLAPGTTVSPTRSTTNTATSTSTAAATETNPATATRTVMPTTKASDTASPTQTFTRTPTLAATKTPVPTLTSTVTSTRTPLPSPTRTATNTATKTHTRTAVPTETATPVPEVVGCTDPATASITDPEPGQRLRDVFTVSGTADTQNFQFYKLEVRPDSETEFRFWRRAETPVRNGELGRIDANIFGPGLFWVRVVVETGAGEAANGVCEIPVYFE